MYMRITFFTLVVFIGSIAAVRADEPTWLFTVPKAESLRDDHFNVGFIYADFGITKNLELGIHGLKYTVSKSKLAFGVSILPPMGWGPYIVISPDIGSGNIHLGLKTAPYNFFAGLEMPVSDKIKFIIELNNGVFAGIRTFPARNWTLDVFAAFATTEVDVYKDVYRYRYRRVEVDSFDPLAGIFFAYSGRL